MDWTGVLWRALSFFSKEQILLWSAWKAGHKNTVESAKDPCASPFSSPFVGAFQFRIHTSVGPNWHVTSGAADGVSIPQACARSVYLLLVTPGRGLSSAFSPSKWQAGRNLSMHLVTELSAIGSDDRQKHQHLPHSSYHPGPLPNTKHALSHKPPLAGRCCDSLLLNMSYEQLGKEEGIVRD